MADYIEVADAIGRPGLRLVLTAGFPGPWGEAAKGILHVKRIPYLAVRQAAGQANEELRAWTGRDNAPVAVYDDEPPRDGWAEILHLAERLAPEPSLIPTDFDERIRMFGLAREICGENGFGWLRRLDIMAQTLATVPEAYRAGARRMAAKYGYSEPAAEAAPARIQEILERLSRQLVAQRDRGFVYFMGETLTALDIYWATFATLYEPLPEPTCAMPESIRATYTLTDEAQRAAADPILLEHRSLIYERHLKTPLEF